MMTPTSRSGLCGALVAALLIGAAPHAPAVELDPAALTYKLPDQLKWRDPTGVAGVNQAILPGDEELRENPRSRSAQLRVLEKI